MNDLVHGFREYNNWRGQVTAAIDRYQTWVESADLNDAASEQRLRQIRARLDNDKLSIAFVAEFSRGKSELINAIFFSGYGQRILPSSVGRTTMCPTELLYDEGVPPSIRLLPIETRAQEQSVSDLRAEESAWTVLPLDVSSGDGMLEAFRQVSLTKNVPAEQARAYGLIDDGDPDSLQPDQDGMVAIPQWRHAIVNFPHPLLKEGLVIIDTPGLNAIGTEPELTLNLIPNAHAVMFLLAADTGVTKSDIDIWRKHIGKGAGRMVVLNKIDSMWDELRSPEEVEAQIRQQVEQAAATLELSENQIFPVSAQKGLVARVNADQELLARSRLPLLERAMTHELIPSKAAIIRSQLLQDLESISQVRHSALSARLRSTLDQLDELRSLRGKNQSIITHMIKRIDLEKKDFHSSLLALQGTRAVFTRLSNDVFSTLGMDMLKEDIRRTRHVMEKSKFSVGLRQAVKDFFEQVHENLKRSNAKTDEINEMMTAMYRKFSAEHGLSLSAPISFSLDKYRAEIRAIEGIYHSQFGTAALLTTPQIVLMQKFFDSIASRVRKCFLQANRDVEAWLKMVMAPLEAQIYEHKSQLKQRRHSVERIHAATGSLEEKLHALEETQNQLETQAQTLALLESTLRSAIHAELQPARMAA